LARKCNEQLQRADNLQVILHWRPPQ